MVPIRQQYLRIDRYVHRLEPQETLHDPRITVLKVRWGWFLFIVGGWLTGRDEFSETDGKGHDTDQKGHPGTEIQIPNRRSGTGPEGNVTDAKAPQYQKDDIHGEFTDRGQCLLEQ